jgi:hypothetical protein
MKFKDCQDTLAAPGLMFVAQPETVCAPLSSLTV